MTIYGKRQMRPCPSFCYLKYIPQKNRQNITHLRQTQTYSFPRTNAKQQTAEVEFLPFPEKTNVMLNLSNTGSVAFILGHRGYLATTLIMLQSLIWMLI